MANLVESAWKIIPMFLSRDVAQAVRFYTDSLLFRIGGVDTLDGETEPFRCSLAIGKKSDANIYFRRCADADFSPREVLIALGTTELDDYYDLLREKGVEIHEKIEDKEYGYRQFSVKDLDGNVIVFFKFLEGGNPGTE